MRFNSIKNTKRPYIIAEIGINHNGNISLAKKMIIEAKKCGANCAKFQFFNAKNLISKKAPKAPYQRSNKKDSQLEIIEKCELSLNKIKILKNYCKKVGIDFLCTPFDIKSLKQLSKIGVKVIKVSSCNLNNIPFLKEIKKLNLSIILSTGMGTLAEVKDACKLFDKNKIIVFQCTSNYPSEIEDSNLNVIKVYKKIFKNSVGYSDHTKGNESALVALGMGVKIFEKHFTLSNKLKGIDQKASADLKQFKNYVLSIHNGFKSIGTVKKKPSKAEKKVAISLRKSLVASKNIKAGEKLILSMVEFKRPGNGIETKYLNKFIGKILKKNISKDNLFKKSHFLNRN